MPDKLPHEVKGLYQYPFSLPIWAYVIIAVLILLLGWAIFRWFQKRKKKPVPTELLSVRLERCIQQYEPSLPFGKQEQIQYYYQLGLWFREYLEEALDFPASDMTLKELRVPLKRKLPLSSEQLVKVLSFFEMSEMIKFADKNVTLEHAKASHDEVCGWIRLLKIPAVDDHSEGGGS